MSYYNQPQVFKMFNLNWLYVTLNKIYRDKDIGDDN